VGDQAQKIAAFLFDLFADDVQPPKGGSSYRDRIWKMTDGELRDEIQRKLGYSTKYESVRIMIVDIQNGRVRFSDGGGCSGGVFGGNGGECSVGNPTTTYWYTLLLPPLPQQYNEDGYQHELMWEAAWHHAICYGYGM
jgi:hypothetical protein